MNEEEIVLGTDEAEVDLPAKDAVLSAAESLLPAEDAGEEGVAEDDGMPSTVGPPRWKFFAVVALVLTGAFAMPLVSLALHAVGTELHSHILLIPLVSVYLVFLKRRDLPALSAPSWLGVLVFCGLGVGFLALVPVLGKEALGKNDYLSVMVAAYLCFLWAVAFGLLGKSWVKTLCFPLFFLVFMIPLPDQAVVTMEHGLVRGSAEVTNLFFQITGTTFLRVTQVTFELPRIGGITVAQECSGIRSTWVLIITSLLASYMFLQSPWRRGVLVAFVVPLGILRNGFRILTLVLLSIHVDPKIMDSPLHHRGGPVFFALSLIPFFLLLWWLRRGEGENKGGRERPILNVEH